MRKPFSRVLAVFLAMVLTVSVSAGSVWAAEASSSDQVVLPWAMLQEVGTYALQHPREVRNAVSDLEQGLTNTGTLNNIDQNVEKDLEIIVTWTQSASRVVQTAALTASLRNTERNRIPVIRIVSAGKQNSGGISQWLENDPAFHTVFISLPDSSQEILMIEPFFVCTDWNNDLVILCIAQNQTPQEVQIQGVYSAQFNSGGNVIARGTAEPFSSPFRLSPCRKDDNGRYIP